MIMKITMVIIIIIIIISNKNNNDKKPIHNTHSLPKII